MSETKHKNFSDEFKAKVALEAIANALRSREFDRKTKPGA